MTKCQRTWSGTEIADTGFRFEINFKNIRNHDYRKIAESHQRPDHGWDGAAHWLAKQSEEEKEHAMDMAHYLIKRGGTAKVSMIDVVPEGWGGYAEVFKNVYEHECHVSELINSLVDVASAEKDKATQDFLWNYVREQVEEEATASAIVDKIGKAGDAGLFYIDAELAKR